MYIYTTIRTLLNMYTTCNSIMPQKATLLLAITQRSESCRLLTCMASQICLVCWIKFQLTQFGCNNGACQTIGEGSDPYATANMHRSSFLGRMVATGQGVRLSITDYATPKNKKMTRKTKSKAGAAKNAPSSDSKYRLDTNHLLEEPASPSSSSNASR